MKRAEEEDVMVYAIGLAGVNPGFGGFGRAAAGRPDPGLPKIAGQTGGGYFELTSTADLGDKRIGVQLGTVYDIYATKTFPHATVIQYPSYQEVTLAVSAGNSCSGSPNLSSESGCTWNWMLARSRVASERVNSPSCEGAMVSGPRRNSA